jgi:hypothetical protein
MRGARRCRPRPIETAEALFDANDHHFPSIETGGAAAIPAILDQSAGMEDAASRAMAERMLTRYAEDAARLPLIGSACRPRGPGFDPSALLSLGGGDVALVLRSLASLPREEPAPAFGLAVCDASGALLFRRRLMVLLHPALRAGLPALAALCRARATRTARHGDPPDTRGRPAFAPGRWRSLWRRPGSAARR